MPEGLSIYQEEYKKETLKAPEYSHPMDELDPNNPLDAETRVTLHRETVEQIRLKGQNRELSPELKYLPNDVLANEVFIRTAKEADGSIYKVVAGIGLTESDVPGIKDTPNTIYAHPQYLESISKKKNQKERQEFFRDEIIPNAEYFVIMGHGWGGKGKNFERYAMKLLNGEIEGAEALDKQGNRVTLTKDDLSKTLVINLDVMGSNNSMDNENANQFTQDQIASQWLEAVDRIGLQVENIKTNTLLRHAENWVQFQKDELPNLFFALKKDFYLSTVNEAKLLNFIKYLQQVQSLENGTWWQKSLAISLGHSMGGLRSLEIAVAENLLDRPEAVLYRKNWRVEAEETAKNWKKGIKLMRYAFTSQIINPEISRFYEELVKTVAEREETSRFFSDSTRDNSPFCMNVALTPVVVGDKNDVEELKKEYPWLFYLRKNKDASPKTAVKSNTINQGIDNVLIKAPNILQEMGLNKLRRMIIKTVKLTPILIAKLKKHIGHDAEYFEELIAGTEDEILNNGTAMNQDSKNLERMTPPFRDISNVDPEDWGNFYRNVAIYIGGKDKTLKPNIMRQLAKRWGLSGSKMAYLGGIVKESPTSNHHFNKEGVDLLMPDLQAFIARNKTLNMDIIRDIFEKIYSQMIEDQILAV